VIDMVTESGPQGTELAGCVRTATLAPSIHNTQPWQFRIRDNGIDVYADWRRRLDVIDPNGRQLIISVGAAIMNLRLAIHQLGWAIGRAGARRAGASQPVAEVGISGPGGPDPTLDELVGSMPRRHTNRQPFTPDPVPGRVADELVAAAGCRGCGVGRRVRLRPRPYRPAHPRGRGPAS
jgi:hypothetical protein